MPEPSKHSSLIIHSPYAEPSSHWSYDRQQQANERNEGRRLAGYTLATPGKHGAAFDDPGRFVELPLVNKIRSRVAAWRTAGYPGVSGVTKRLLEYWHDPEQRKDVRFFFCQLEAIETLIWLREAPPAERCGIEIPGDGGPFARFCTKLATGAGKTVVMAMLIAWQVLNKVAHPGDSRFSKYIFVVAPGLTVRRRLAVLLPSNSENYYETFNILPSGQYESLRQGKVVVRNWHALYRENEQALNRKRSVDKRGVMSDEALVRAVLGEFGRARNILVINDEAHHAWRASGGRAGSTAEAKEATVWMEGLDAIHRARKLLAVHDFSATPFAPSGRRSSEETLFGWVVSDFGLPDAIEAGLVKTPRVVIRDNSVPGAKDCKSKIYHIYQHVSEDLNRSANAEEPLPDLVNTAYHLLGADWLKTREAWEKVRAEVPPVLISVTNKTETAARVKHAFEKGRIAISELCEKSRILHIDSRVLGEAEQKEEPASLFPQTEDAGEGGEGEEGEKGEKKLNRKEFAERLRQQVSTVGQANAEGARFQNIISVNMLSEGWDARTVTHIMGLRAFRSQLLCEQVVGRGLRRRSYEIDPATGFFPPEFVNVFGIPFTFMPHATEEGEPLPQPYKTRIEALAGKSEFAIQWPRVLRIDRSYTHRLSLDSSALSKLVVDASETPSQADITPTISGKFDLTCVKTLDLEEMGRRTRMQTIVFKAAAQVYDEVKPGWQGERSFLLGQLVQLVYQFLESGNLEIKPRKFGKDPLRRRILLILHLSRIVQHLIDEIKQNSVLEQRLVLDPEQPLSGTRDMLPWHTAAPCGRTARSHISHCVYDSSWEASEAYILEHDPKVQAWVKNDHLGFEIPYLYQGGVRKYRPDFLVQLKNGEKLVLEVKGQERDLDRAKRAALQEWVKAVTADGRFGVWKEAISSAPTDLHDTLAAL